MASVVPQTVAGQRSANITAYNALCASETAVGPNGGTFREMYPEYDESYGTLFFYFLRYYPSRASWYSVGVVGLYRAWLRENGVASTQYTPDVQLDAVNYMTRRLRNHSN